MRCDLVSEHALTASQLYIEHIVHAYVQASIAQLQHTSQEVHSIASGQEVLPAQLATSYMHTSTARSCALHLAPGVKKPRACLHV